MAVWPAQRDDGEKPVINGELTQIWAQTSLYKHDDLYGCQIGTPFGPLDSGIELAPL